MKKKFDETNAKIERAFASLIADGYHLEDITVTNLVKVAGITRGTFYLHYDNINAVALEIENKLLNEFDLSTIALDSPKPLKQFFTELFTYFEKNENLYKNLLHSEATVMFVDRLNSKIREHVLTLLKERSLWRADLELDISYHCDAAIQMILQYFRGELNYSMNDIRVYITNQFLRLITPRPAVAS